MPKITLATIKSFIRKNEGHLYINQKSSFNGMVDMVTDCNGGFKPATKREMSEQYTLGFNGLWIVGQSRDYFTPYEDSEFKGFEIYNCCGTSIIAIKK